MTITAADLSAHPGPVYQAIAAAIAEAMAAGRVRRDERLPPQRDLAWQLKVTVGTVGRAYDLLIKRGLARGEVGRGTYVNGSPPQQTFVSNLRGTRDDNVLDLTSNTIAPTPVRQRFGALLAECATDAEAVAQMGLYPPIVGHLKHRELCVAWLERLGLPSSPGRLSIMNGTQSAIATALLALASPGAPLLVETLSYTGAINLARRLGLHLEPVAMDDQGMLPQALRAGARHSGARVMLVQPSLQNPTTAMMSNERRREIAEVAREQDILIIEDDVYGPLVPDRPSPIATMAPERTVYLTGISKFLAPGIRFAVAHMPESLVGRVAAAQAELALGSSSLSAELFARAFTAGLLDDALIEQRQELQARQTIALDVLGGSLPDPSMLVSRPYSLHLWLHLPEWWNPSDLVLSLAREGIMIGPGDRYYTGRGMPPRAVRLSISAPATRARLASGLQAIAARLARGSLQTMAAV